MKNFQILFSLLFFSLIIINSSFAYFDEESPSPSPIPVASDGHISISPSSDFSPSPSPTPSPSPVASEGPTAEIADPTIKKICKSTDYPELCLSAISPSLNEKTDVYSVSEMVIKSVMETTKTAISAAKKLANSPITPSALGSIIKDCTDSYNDAVDNFENALAALKEGDLGTLNSMLSAALTDFGDCDDQLTGQDAPTAIMDLNDKLFKMTSNCLAITTLIK